MYTHMHTIYTLYIRLSTHIHIYLHRDIDVDCTFVVHCDLYDESGKENRSVVYVPSSIPPSEQHAPQGPAGSLVLSLKSPRPIRNLLGTITANASRLFNDRNEPGVYFIFHDLSIRTDGRFSLKFLMLGLPCNTSKLVISPS